MLFAISHQRIRMCDKALLKKSLFILQTVAIGKNPLRGIHPEAFDGVPIESLSVNSAFLEEAPSLTNICDTLETLSLKCGGICSLRFEPSHFSPCTNLRFISITHAGLSSLPWLRSISSSIEVVSVEHNRIETLKSISKITFASLRNLRLSDNLITHIQPSMLLFPRLEEIYLLGNRLSNINFTDCSWGDDKRHAKQHTLVNLYTNPWDCSEDFSWLMQNLHKEGRRYKTRLSSPRLDILMVGRMKCASPNNLRGKAVMMINDAQQYGGNTPQPRGKNGMYHCTCKRGGHSLYYNIFVFISPGRFKPASCTCTHNLVWDEIWKAMFYRFVKKSDAL